MELIPEQCQVNTEFRAEVTGCVKNGFDFDLK
jgi:hypothetical protein